MDRIYFVDNPWPNGHRIVNFKWSAHFKDEEEENEEVDDWHAKIVWNNYRSCTISSQEWHNKGFRVGSDEAPFDLEALSGKEYVIDFLTKNEKENFDFDLTAFDVYLLGHDATAFHTIKFTKVENHTYQIDWKGKLALAYKGDYEFRYDFHTCISSTSFSGITIPEEMTDFRAYELLKRFVSKPSLFALQNDNGKRKFSCFFVS